MNDSYQRGLHELGDVLAWLKAVVTATGVDTVPETLGPATVGAEPFLYRIPYPDDADWTGAVRYHALIDTLNTNLNVPADVEAALALAREEGVPVTARGGGTSQSGQTVGPGLIIDNSKYLDRLDAFARRATSVEAVAGASRP